MEAPSILALGGSTPTEDDDAALIAAARADLTAFSAIYERYLARVYRYLRARTSSDEDAADLTQQVFLQALDGLAGYRERGAPFSAWLFRIARNLAIDVHRRRRSTLAWDQVPAAIELAAAADLDASMLQQETLEQLRRLVAELDSDKRDVLMLRFAAGLTIREIAPVVGKSEAAVKKQLFRTLLWLKEHYHE